MTLKPRKARDGSGRTVLAELNPDGTERRIVADTQQEWNRVRQIDPWATSALLSESFDGPDGIFCSSDAFWSGQQDNPNWFAESGSFSRKGNLGWTYSPVFRMWTRRTDLSFVQVELDVRFNGWAGASQSWHGINLWLNRKLQSGSRVNDGAQEGYVIDFLNYDGRLYLMRHVGDAYDLLTDPVTWSPTPGQWYRWGGRVVKTSSGARIDVLRDGQVVQSATDSNPLLGGRVGLRSDYADFHANDLRITR